MPKIPIVKCKDFYKQLLKYGCLPVSIRGSHHKITYPHTKATTVISIHASQDVSKGAYSSTLSQLGIDINDFLEFVRNN